MGPPMSYFQIRVGWRKWVLSVLPWSFPALRKFTISFFPPQIQYKAFGTFHLILTLSGSSQCLLSSLKDLKGFAPGLVYQQSPNLLLHSHWSSLFTQWGFWVARSYFSQWNLQLKWIHMKCTPPLQNTPFPLGWDRKFQSPWYLKRILQVTEWFLGLYHFSNSVIVLGLNFHPSKAISQRT